jgi:hypothetical protein
MHASIQMKLEFCLLGCNKVLNDLISKLLQIIELLNVLIGILCRKNEVTVKDEINIWKVMDRRKLESWKAGNILTNSLNLLKNRIQYPEFSIFYS